MGTLPFSDLIINMKPLLLLTLIVIALGQDRLTKQKVMAEINYNEGVYDLTEATFDLMINWNDLVLVCFWVDSH